jgi:hypothetical protein
VIYRNPVDVMISMHKYLRVGRKQYTQGEMKDVGLYKGKPIFLPYLKDQDVCHSLVSGQLSKVYEERFRYDLNAITLRENFNDGDFMEILYEDFKEDNQKIMDDICTFIGIKSITLPIKKTNVSYSYRFPLLHYGVNYLFSKITGLDSNHLLNAYTENSMNKSLIHNIYKFNELDHDKVLSDMEREKIRCLYEPMVKEFSRITKIDVSKWGY